MSALPVAVDDAVAPEVGAAHLQVPEWGYLDVDAPLILRDGRLDVYPSLVKQDYFTLRASPAGLTLQAGGWIGVIPINDRLTIEVVPRVPLKNISRVIRIAEHVPVAIEDTARLYTPEPELYPSLIDLYARTLVRHVDELAFRGLIREYERREEATSFPRGRILMSQTMKSLVPRGIEHKAAVSWFQRTTDNPANRCIKYAIWFLARCKAEAPGPRAAGHREIVRRLNRAYRAFDGVQLDLRRGFMFDPLVIGATPVPRLRSYYRPVLDLCCAIVRQQAVSLDQPGGQVGLPSLVLNMSKAFEAYLRQVLVAWAADRDGVRVLDGNRKPPGGGEKPLFDTGGEAAANPDIVIVRTGTDDPPIILEVKYKPSERPIPREDLNQAIAYGVSYGSKRILLMQPRGPGDEEPQGLRPVGTIGDMHFERYVFDLGADDLVASEHKLAADISTIVAAA